MRKIIQNKRGDISIMLLVLGVFTICAFAIISFYISENNIQKNFIGVNLIEKMNFEIEKYNFYKNLMEFSDEEILEILNEGVEIKEDEIGDSYFYLEEIEKGKKLMSIRYYP